MKPRRIVHRGTVQAAAFWMDERVTGSVHIRRRILECSGVDEVRRMMNGYFVRLRAPAWVNVEQACGVPLVVCRGILLGAPLDPDELDALGAPPESVVLVRAGETIVVSPQSCTLEDVATWIDLSDWSAEDATPLGEVLATPRAAPVAKEVDPRQMAGIGPPSEEARALSEALAKARERSVTTTSTGFSSSLLTSLSAMLATAAAWLGRKPSSSSRKTSQSRALVAMPAAQAPDDDWADRLRMALNTAAAKLLLWARLASWVGRRQAEYLSKTFSMFDSGDLDQALRHAIPLGDGSGKPKPLALGVPSPRADLSIHSTRGEASSTLGFGADVFEALRLRYRKAVEQLEKQGRIKEAAFVLAELLGASEEAVSFLEKHREYQLAAELAEGRNLDPALVIRQWILAGNRARAVLIARRTGAFAAAIARLEPSHPEHAALLRILWANQLAESGAYAAAVQAIWPVERARHIARDWIERGIEAGGLSGARLLATKATLVPEAFDSVVAIVRALPRDESEESIDTWTALGQSVIAHPSSKTTRILARACVRALMPHSMSGNIRALVDRLATAMDDPVLLADMRHRAPNPSQPRNVRYRVGALSHCGLARTVNEDGYCLALVEESLCVPYAGAVREHTLSTNGALFAVADGMGGTCATDAVNLAFNTLTQCVQSADKSPNAIGQGLAHAVEKAGATIFDKAAEDRKYAGSGATITATWLVGDILWIAHVGDTRAYLLRDQKLTLLTKDHSLVNELLHSGKLKAEEVESFEHKTVITRALGVTEHVDVDLVRLRVLDGDRMLLCTDGVHGMIDDGQIADVLLHGNDVTGGSSRPLPRAVCDALKDKVFAAGAHDNLAMIIVDIRMRDARDVDSREVIVEQVHVEEKPRPTVRVMARTAADVGTIPIHDAVVLPGGRLLVALGEAGVRMLSREGKTLLHFDQPAHRIVLSDHGDRAIIVATRGQSQRMARIDLVRRRAQRWMDAAMREFASTFDGSVWFVANEQGVYAIDALDEGFQSIWELTNPGSYPDGVARTANGASFLVGREVWLIELPSYRLRTRRTLPPMEKCVQCSKIELASNGSAICWVSDESTTSYGPVVHHAHAPAWVSLGAHVERGEFAQTAIDESGSFGAFCHRVVDTCILKVFELREKRLLLEMHLEGAGRVSMRFQGKNLVVADESGRAIVVDVQRGKVVFEWRV
jgi:serine/threonine protein phosphatase PrpC